MPEVAIALGILALGLFALATIIASLGAFWMMWAAIHHRNPVSKVLLAAFVPFVFVWYYGEIAADRERTQFRRLLRIATTAVVTFTFIGIALNVHRDALRIASIALLLTCWYAIYLTAEREQVRAIRR